MIVHNLAAWKKIGWGGDVVMRHSWLQLRAGTGLGSKATMSLLLRRYQLPKFSNGSDILLTGQIGDLLFWQPKVLFSVRYLLLPTHYFYYKMH